MDTGSDEEGMKRTSRGRKPQYTLLVVFCLGELYVNELRRLGNKRRITGFTQTAIHDCVRQYVDVKNPDVVKSAIFDAISHGLVATTRTRNRGRNLFVPTRAGLVLYIMLDETLFDVNVLALYQETPGKVREKIKRVVMVLKFALDGIISQLNLYSVLTNVNADPIGHRRILDRLDLLRRVRDSVSGFSKEIPGNTEAMRLCNIVKYLLEILKKMEVVGITALCNAADRIIDDADPLTWDENVLG